MRLDAAGSGRSCEGGSGTIARQMENNQRVHRRHRNAAEAAEEGVLYLQGRQDRQRHQQAWLDHQARSDQEAGDHRHDARRQRIRIARHLRDRWRHAQALLHRFHQRADGAAEEVRADEDESLCHAETEMSRTDWSSLNDAQLLAQCEVDTYRASGPGGQKRNKTSSAVRIRHLPSELLVIAEESRSQHENRAKALRRLRQAFYLRLREPFNADMLLSIGGRSGVASARSAAGKFEIGRRAESYW